MNGRILALAALVTGVIALGLPAAATSQSGTVIELTDQTWTCLQPLTNYGPLPITVHLAYTTNFPGQGARIGKGCVGPGKDGNVDLVLLIDGDGITHGTQDDAVRLMNAALTYGSMDISGQIDCGNNTSGFHQDGVQVLGGKDIGFVNVNVGDYDGQQATCQAAGGVFFYSDGTQENIDVIGGSYIGCNKGVFGGRASPGSEVKDARFRSGHADGDPVCARYVSGAPCTFLPEFLDSGGTSANLTCERYPFSAPPPPPPPPPTPPPAGDTTRPHATANVSRGRRGGSARLEFVLTDDRGWARAILRIRRKSALIGTVRTSFLRADGRTLHVPWRVPRSAEAPLSFCVTAFDRAGNQSRPSCARLMLSG